MQHENSMLTSVPTVGTTVGNAVIHAWGWGSFCTKAVQAAALSIPKTGANSPPDIPGNPPGRYLSTHSLSGPPRCKAELFWGKVLTHCLNHILQLDIYFAIYENPKEWPNRAFSQPQMSFSLLILSQPVVQKSVFHSWPQSYRNYLLLPVFWSTGVSW